MIFCCDLQIERKKHSLDETSLNNVALICARPNTLDKETYVVTPSLEVSWGWWETTEECRHYEANFFLSEFSLQVEKFQVTEKSKIVVLAQNYIHGNGHLRYPSFRDTSLPQPLTSVTPTRFIRFNYAIYRIQNRSTETSNQSNESIYRYLGDCFLGNPHCWPSNRSQGILFEFKTTCKGFIYQKAKHSI